MVYIRKVSVFHIHEGCVQQSYINVILPLLTRNELYLTSHKQEVRSYQLQSIIESIFLTEPIDEQFKVFISGMYMSVFKTKLKFGIQ